MDAIFHRTSIRRFQPRPVESEKIEMLLRAAMQAPSAANQQPWEFYVIRNTEILAHLAQATPYTSPAKNAPMAIVIVYRDDTITADFRNIDCAIAAENILLEADSLGLGAVMLGISPIPAWMEAVEKVLELPQNLHAFTVIPVGYPEKNNPQKDRYDTRRVHFMD